MTEAQPILYALIETGDEMAAELRGLAELTLESAGESDPLAANAAAETLALVARWESARAPLGAALSGGAA